MQRRDFLKTTTAVGAALAAGGGLPDRLSAQGAASASQSQAPKPLAQRPLGQTGQKLSIVGFGGITLHGQEADPARKLAAEAIESGINWVDSSPEYNGSEPIVGQAFEPDRDKIFLAGKTKKRTYDEAREQFEGSLKSLRTDHLDLYQLHVLSDLKKDVDVAFGKGGALELLTEARKAGKVRYLGFSAHSVEAALAAMDRFEFDTIMFPVNFGAWIGGDFGPQVIARAKEKKMGILALKTLCKQPWQRDGWREKRRKYRLWYEPVSEAPDDQLVMRWTLSQPITAMLPPGHPGLMRRAIEIGRSYQALDDDEKAAVAQLAKSVQPMFRYRGGERDDAQAALWAGRCPHQTTA